MEIRAAKLIVNQSGGNSSKNAETFRVTLPNAWVNELGLDFDNRNLELRFDGEKIIITKKPDINEFIRKKQCNNLLKLEYFNFDDLCTVIIADYTDYEIIIENKTNDFLHCAFGKNNNPDWADYLEFIKSRCVPESRDRIRNYLEAIGLNSYDPIEIIKKTNGKMAEDNQWLRVTLL